MQSNRCLVFCHILHLGGSGSMENTAAGCADDLPTILEIFKNEPKSRSVNNYLQQLNLSLPAKALPSFLVDKKGCVLVPRRRHGLSLSRKPPSLDHEEETCSWQTGGHVLLSSKSIIRLLVNRETYSRVEREHSSCWTRLSP